MFSVFTALLTAGILCLSDAFAGTDWIEQGENYVEQTLVSFGLTSAAEASDTPTEATVGTPPLSITDETEIRSGQTEAAPQPTPEPLPEPVVAQGPHGPVDMINKIPLEYADQSISAEDIVNDKMNLLPQDFKVPDGLKKRVGFWLDIYTKYSSHFVLVHDAQNPWIVYKVVDLREIYDRGSNRFTKDANDRKTVIKSLHEVRAVLTRLAHRRDYRNLKPDEYQIYKLLEVVPGSRKKVFTTAAKNVRDQRGQKDFYRQGLISSSRYLTEMEEIFAGYDLPVELVRLPLVESSFNLDATSKVGASGVWQFMANMGKKYLRVGDRIDERNSPIKATDAAAKLMLSNFRVLKSWPLAVTAYNHGAGGIVHACKQLHTRSISDIVTKYKSRSFSFASQNFFAEFMAALYGEKYQDKVFGPMPKNPALEAETTDLRYSMRAKTLVNITGMTIEELKLYNPDLRAQAVAGATFLPVGYHIRLPLGRKARLELFNQEAVEAHNLVTHKKTKLSSI